MLTIPAGVPALASAAVTVAVQLVPCPTATGAGLHDTDVLVVSRLIATDAWAEWPGCSMSPAYFAVIRCMPEPAALGVYVTWQEAAPAGGRQRAARAGAEAAGRVGGEHDAAGRGRLADTLVADGDGAGRPLPDANRARLAAERRAGLSLEQVGLAGRVAGGVADRQRTAVPRERDRRAEAVVGACRPPGSASRPGSRRRPSRHSAPGTRTRRRRARAAAPAHQARLRAEPPPSPVSATPWPS